MEFKNSSDYSVSVFGSSGFLVKMQYVNDIASCIKWLNSSYKYSDWKVINVYARRSGRFLAQYKKNEPFVSKPK